MSRLISWKVLQTRIHMCGLLSQSKLFDSARQYGVCPCAELNVCVCSALSRVDVASSREPFSVTILVRWSLQMGATLPNVHQSRETASVRTARMNSTGSQENGKMWDFVILCLWILCNACCFIRELLWCFLVGRLSISSQFSIFSELLLQVYCSSISCYGYNRLRVSENRERYLGPRGRT